jgi:hypothetical protein
VEEVCLQVQSCTYTRKSEGDMGKREEYILEGMGGGEMALSKRERCVGGKERKKEEQLREDKEWSKRILSSIIEYQERKQSHAKWLDTLTLTAEERRVAGREAMTDYALEMIERDTITEKN